MFQKKTKKQQVPTPRRRLPEYAIEHGRGSSETGQGQYRRNQTVSSYKRDTPAESERQKSHNLVIQRRKLGAVFIGAAGVAALLLILLWQFIARPVVVFGDTSVTQEVDTTPYEKAISTYVERMPSQRFRASLNEVALGEYLSSVYGEVASVKVAQGFGLPSQVRFTVQFRQPVASWHIHDKEYFVDKEGVVFEKNYLGQPGVSIVDESGINPEQGSAIASSRLLGFLGKIVDQAKGRGYTVSEALLPADTTRRVDVKLEGGESYVRFSTDRGVGAQVEDMDAALRYFKSRGMKPRYIDVRVSGRAAYR